MQKILLDTDIGGDVDDALCLAYLLAQSRCELLGVTTVSGEPDRRAAIASALCRAAGRDVPILPGASEPLIVEQRQPHAHQAARLGDRPHDRDFPTAEAVPFLRRAIRSHPGDVTLLAIGPLTNVATLFTLDPEIPSLLERLVLMAGWFTERPSRAGAGDWNVLCDPHAAAIVYGAGVRVHRSVPLDVTRPVTMTAPDLRARSSGAVLEVVGDLIEGEAEADVGFHDPLTAATIFDDRICTFRRGRVEVDLGDDDTMGMTRLHPGEPHEVAQSADPGRFFEHYFSVVGG